MKYIRVLIILVIFSSCDVLEQEKKDNRHRRELIRKNNELDYLERLYKMKNDLEIEKGIRIIDSLIQVEKQ